MAWTIQGPQDKNGQVGGHLDFRLFRAHPGSSAEFWQCGEAHRHVLRSVLYQLMVTGAWLLPVNPYVQQKGTNI